VLYHELTWISLASGNSVDAVRELEMWKRVIKGALGSIVYGTLEQVVKRELAKGEQS
jgi:SH3-like domain-containing protein